MKARLKSKGWNALHFARICSVKELTLVAKNQNHAADFEQSELTVLTENRAVHDVYSLN